MNIGYANLYSFRPHVEHLFYMEHLLTKSGHKSFFLTCDAALSNCYPRVLKSSSRLRECPKCIIGGVRSFPSKHITPLKQSGKKLPVEILDRIALSSSCTLHRTESEEEWHTPPVHATRKSLYKPVNTAFQSAMRWIDENKLDAVICFNGRMEITQALTYACEASGIPYVTHERTWFGDGLHLISNANCLSIKAVNEMGDLYKDIPLTTDQALHAGKLVGQRFLQKNSLEWRLYNQNPVPAPWPLKHDGSRVLILPSSKNEFAGHNEWLTGWPSNTQALDDFFETFSISPQQVVLRCHPNWAETIGKVTGDRSLNHYLEWAKARKIYAIHSAEKANTYDLIQEADIVVMNGGSSAVEAGACGKQIICLGASSYEYSGFVRTFKSRSDLNNKQAHLDLNPEDIMRKTLRYLYLRSRRFPQFVDYVKAVETIKYRYFEGGDPVRLENIILTGQLVADDDSHASDQSHEDQVVELLSEKKWGELAAYENKPIDRKEFFIKRRLWLRWVDETRALWPRGDR